jgi:hypothetical protein
MKGFFFYEDFAVRVIQSQLQNHASFALDFRATVETE